MPCKWIIVVTTYHLRIDNFWDVWEALVLEHSFIIFLVFQKICKSKHFCFFVIVLKFGEPQSHAFNVGNIKIVSSYLTLGGVPELVELQKSNYFAYKDLIEKKELIHSKARYFGQ